MRENCRNSALTSIHTALVPRRRCLSNESRGYDIPIDEEGAQTKNQSIIDLKLLPLGRGGFIRLHQFWVLHHIYKDIV